jgi:hypothetical protein
MHTTNVFRTLAVVAAFAAFAPSASAQTSLSATVETKVSLASKCRWSGGSAPTGVQLDFGTYTAFQTTAKGLEGTAPTLVFECTRGFGTSPTVAWDTTNGTAAGGGLLAGLSSPLSVSSGVASGGPAAPAAGGLGTPQTVTFTLGGSIPGDQVGAGAGGAATANRTLTLTF